MCEDLTGIAKTIHDLERAIRVWQLVRDNAQQKIDDTTAQDEKKGVSPETASTVAQARADIVRYNNLILKAKVRIDLLEKGEFAG
jgi:hypothetical protein